MGNVIDYAFLSQDSYTDKKSGAYLPENWERLEEEEIHNKSGYDAIVYRNTVTNEIVVAHRGTEFSGQPIKDLIMADGSIAFGNIPKQAVEASQFVQEIEKKYGVTVTNTGHSLGGFIADLVSKRLGSKAVTFDQPSLPTDKYNLIWEKLYGKPLCPTSDVTMIMSRPDVVNNGGNPKGDIIKLDEFVKSVGNRNDFISAPDLGSLVYATLFPPIASLSIVNKLINSYLSLDYHDLEKTIIPGLLKYVQKYGDSTSLQDVDVKAYLAYLSKRQTTLNDKVAAQIAQDKADKETYTKEFHKYKMGEQDKTMYFQKTGRTPPPPLNSGILPDKPIGFVASTISAAPK